MRGIARKAFSAAGLCAATLAFVSVGAAAKPLSDEECGLLDAEMRILLSDGIDRIIQKGPDWARANLQPSELDRIKVFLRVEEDIAFRCNGTDRKLSKPRLVKSLGGSIPLPVRKPVPGGAGDVAFIVPTTTRADAGKQLGAIAPASPRRPIKLDLMDAADAPVPGLRDALSPPQLDTTKPGPLTPMRKPAPKPDPSFRSGAIPEPAAKATPVIAETAAAKPDEVADSVPEPEAVATTPVKPAEAGEEDVRSIKVGLITPSATGAPESAADTEVETEIVPAPAATAAQDDGARDDSEPSLLPARKPPLSDAMWRNVKKLPRRPIRRSARPRPKRTDDLPSAASAFRVD